MTGYELKSRRQAAGISGCTLARKAGTSRTRLGDFERGDRPAPAGEIDRIAAVLDDLIETKAALQEYAAGRGWPVEAPVMGVGVLQ